MFPGKEIHDLILMIDKNREVIGNSQYAFDINSEARERIAFFSNGIPRIRQEAFARMDQLFWEELPWVERTDEITDLARYYTWSLVYQITFNAKEQKEVFEKMEKVQKDFAKKMELYRAVALTKEVKQELLIRIKERVDLAFDQADAWLECHSHGWEPA